MIKAIFCWSGGKDSARALHEVQQNKEFEVVGLLTTLNKTHKRISMHGVHESLLDAQAEALGYPLTKMWVDEGTNSEYEQKMEEVLLQFKRDHGVTHVIFGDIFLEDLRAYRDNNLAKVDLLSHYPLWKKDTAVLAQEFLSMGFKTMICCVNDGHLLDAHVGVPFNQEFIGDLPAQVDPCGENGEFHTYVFDGPIFSNPIDISVGMKLYKPLPEKFITPENPTKGFWYAELELA